MHLNTKFCSIAAVWPQFQCHVMTPAIRAPICGVRVDLKGRRWYQSECRPAFLFDFYTHYRPILHRSAIKHTTVGLKHRESSHGGVTSSPPRKLAHFFIVFNRCIFCFAGCIFVLHFIQLIVSALSLISTKTDVVQNFKTVGIRLLGTA